VGRDRVTKEFLHWAHAWVHPVALERRKSEVPKYRDFEACGDLTIVERAKQDLEEIVQYVVRIEDSGLLERIGCDPAGLGEAFTYLTKAREDGGAGLAEDRVVSIPQSWKLMSAIQTTERFLSDNVFTHGASPLMAWCVGNARTELKGNALMITKQISGRGKIDPLMATFNAVDLISRNPEARNQFVTDEMVVL
jgi:phage terminase large subunit-like protein